MKSTIFNKVFDSGAEPYIEQKHVIMCRSGIQLYHKSELASFMSDGNTPPTDKEWYREYRPASVVVKAKKLCSSLPVTKEHPTEWVTPDNWKELAGGTTDKNVEVVALDGEADGEIGLESTITFYDRELYEYFSDNNKEVSLGYECTKHWVDNPDEVGYDIILDEITEVNHLAITRAGRGGSKVALIDTILGGMKPMRTGIFAWLGKNKQVDSAPFSFGNLVFDSLKNSKGTTEEELGKEMQSVLDSCSVLKDCERKTTLVNAVKDCFDNKSKALENETELVKAFDSMYVSVSGDSLEEIINAFKAVGTDNKISVVDSEKTEEKTESKEEDKKCPECGAEVEDSEKTEEKTESKEGKQTDSVKVLDDAMKALVKELVAEEVKSVLGIKPDTSVTGIALDSKINGSEGVITRDYSSFLDR